MIQKRTKIKKKEPATESVRSKHKNQLLSQIQALAGYIPLVVATAFAISVARTFGAQVVLGPELLRYFSVSDYFNQSIPYMVYISLALGIAGFLRMLTFRSSGKATPRKRKPNEKSAKAERVVDRVITILTYMVFAAGGILVGIKSGDWLLGLLRVLMIVMCFGWPRFALWYLRDPKHPERWTWKNILLVAAFPALMLLSFFTGAVEARYPVSPSRAHIVRTGTGDIRAQYILPLDRHWIIRKVDGKVIIIPATDVKMVENP